MRSSDGTVGETGERIRAAALTLFAERGVAATSLREVARSAGVAPGLVGHYFGSKDGLQEAVDDYVVELFREALGSVPIEGEARAVAARRDAALTAMIEAHPQALDYLRRAVVIPEKGVEALARKLVAETIRQTTTMRDQGMARTDLAVTEQAVEELVRQLGNRLVQPMLDHLWRVSGAESSAPAVRVGFRR